MTHDIPLILAAVAYLLAAVTLFQSIRQQSTSWRSISLSFAIAGVLLHMVAQYSHWFGGAQPDVSIPHLLSLCALVIMLILVFSAFTSNTLYDAGLVALPIATVVLLLEWVLPNHPISMSTVSTGTSIHLISSVLAFGLLSIAGVYALFVYIIDYFLRNHHLNPLVRTLPALDVLESLLFKLITAGFLVLTVSLGSGMGVSKDIFAHHLVHKTVLSIATWAVFGILLWGRWKYGWRGSLAVRLTLVGIVLLALSYFGSKLVLEMILDRNWQS